MSFCFCSRLMNKIGIIILKVIAMLCSNESGHALPKTWGASSKSIVNHWYQKASNYHLWIKRFTEESARNRSGHTERGSWRLWQFAICELNLLDYGPAPKAWLHSALARLLHPCLLFHELQFCGTPRFLVCFACWAQTNVSQALAHGHGLLLAVHAL